MQNTITSYNNSTVTTTEIGTVLEDFIYGRSAKLTIPSLVPFMNTSSVSIEKRSINKNNIQNKDVDALNYTDTEACNYITIDIPIELYRSSNDHNTYQGYKGEQFLISFIGGDINQPVAIRRL